MLAVSDYPAFILWEREQHLWGPLLHKYLHKYILLYRTGTKKRYPQILPNVSYKTRSSQMEDSSCNAIFGMSQELSKHLLFLPLTLEGMLNADLSK